VDTSEYAHDWEDLPPGEWLDNDEDGTHWYLGDDGRHWYSTDDGYRVWSEDSGEVTTQSNDSISVKHLNADEDDFFEDEEEEKSPKLPTPDIGFGTAVIGILIGFVIIGWTLGIAMPTTDENLVIFGQNSADFAEEKQISLDGLETVQTLNDLTVIFAVGMIGVAGLSFFHKSPWWGLSAANLALVALLLLTAYTAVTAEKNWVEACDPQTTYCYTHILPTIWDIDAIYPAGLSAIGLLIILNGSLKAWANFDPNEEEEEAMIILLFSVPFASC
jgi:hypothetical protein